MGGNGAGVPFGTRTPARKVSDRDRTEVSACTRGRHCESSDRAEIGRSKLSRLEARILLRRSATVVVWRKGNAAYRGVHQQELGLGSKSVGCVARDGLRTCPHGKGGHPRPSDDARGRQKSETIVMTTGKIDQKRRNVLAAMLAAPLAGCAAELGFEEGTLGTEAEGLTAQELMDRFYELTNIVTIRITMPADRWETLRAQQPAPTTPNADSGVCNWNHIGDRYPWYEATSVEVSGTKFPSAPVTLSRVGIKKKSFCGSLSTSRPSLKLDFGEYVSGNKAVIEAAIGTTHLTLNNCKQDASHIRQPLGYQLFKLAGLPYCRCNFVRVYVNGTLLGSGMYVNVEPIRERFVERNFAGNVSGNLYEFEKDDFLESRVPYIDAEKMSRYTDKKDLTFAAKHIAANGLSGMAQVIDMPHFIKLYAMEFLLKHWDGYTTNINNTYVYNDVAAVANPGVNNVKFKLIPWGIDQILQPGSKFNLGVEGLGGRLVRSDPTRLNQVRDQVRLYRQNVFNETTQETVLKPLIDQMEAILLYYGIPNAATEVAVVRQQLKLVKSAGYLFAGLPATSSVYLINKDTGTCLHASDTETIPFPNVNPPRQFEVVHRVPEDSRSDRWFFKPHGAGIGLQNEKYSRWFHASGTARSPANHLYLYTYPDPGDNFGGAEEFDMEMVDYVDQFQFSGYFKLRNRRTGLYATYGANDLTPSGRPRVYQDSAANASQLFLY